MILVQTPTDSDDQSLRKRRSDVQYSAINKVSGRLSNIFLKTKALTSEEALAVTELFDRVGPLPLNYCDKLLFQSAPSIS